MRIEDLSKNIFRPRSLSVLNFVFYSVATDESSDATDTVQLITFICELDRNFIITEKLAALVHFKNTTEADGICIPLCKIP
jgi:hypothetical protein